jgi:peptidoglycan/LPS O-acetylase OafA/YrhL
LIKTPAYWTAACVLLGNISYPIYLLHAPITEALNLQSVSIFATQHHAIARYFLPTVILLATGIAYLAMKFYDVPVRKLLTRRYNSAIASKITVVADCTRLARQAGSLNKEQTDAT